jgi:BirA family transcriptional regulator, biotin operon repressor / biotin---[acetyl-CoA-carboxylase] ligase
MEERIIEIFRKSRSQYISGEQISEELHVSRSAIWKHIEKLRELGYEFDAVPHLGYCLKKTPDKLYPFEIYPILKTHTIGKQIIYYNELDSTNLTAYQLAKNKTKEGLVVIAEKQNKGRGRLSRHWSSPKAKGIYISIVLKPEMTPFDAPVITLMAAVSVARAIRETYGIQALIKWPNDIIVKGKKIAGILTEMEAESDKIKFLILGIGVNINAKQADIPPTATSVFQQQNQSVSRMDLLVSILEKLEHNYKELKESGFSRTRQEWKKFSATIGKRVRANCMHRVIEGTAVDIDIDGALKIRLDNGFHEKIFAGDLTLLR